MKSMHKKRKVDAVIFHVVACVIGFFMIYPMLWLLASSFKSNETMFTNTYSLIPEVFDAATNYMNAWEGVAGVSFLTFLGNTVFVTVLAMVGCVFISLLAAYAFTRIKFRGGNFWFSCVMVTLMIPSQVMVVPQYIRTAVHYPQKAEPGRYQDRTGAAVVLRYRILYLHAGTVLPRCAEGARRGC